MVNKDFHLCKIYCASALQSFFQTWLLVTIKHHVLRS